MATQAAIDSVLTQLPNEAASLGVTNEIIGDVIDEGLSESKTMLKVWKIFAGKVTTIVDISESSSSRSNGVFFDRAKQMIDYWQLRSDAEDKADDILPPRAHASSLRAVRV